MDGESPWHSAWDLQMQRLQTHNKFGQSQWKKWLRGERNLKETQWFSVLFRGLGVRHLTGVSGIASEASVIVPAHLFVLAVMGPHFTLVNVWLAAWQREREKVLIWPKKLDDNINTPTFWPYSRSSKKITSCSRHIRFECGVLGLLLHFQHLRISQETQKGRVGNCSPGKPPLQPHSGLTAAPLVAAPNHKAISGTATWIHHQKVPLTQPARFMAPSIKHLTKGGGGKNNSSPFERAAGFQINPLQEKPATCV